MTARGRRQYVYNYRAEDHYNQPFSEEELERDANPFALLVLTHLKARATRARWKERLLPSAPAENGQAEAVNTERSE